MKDPIEKFAEIKSALDIAETQLNTLETKIADFKKQRDEFLQMMKSATIAEARQKIITLKERLQSMHNALEQDLTDLGLITSEDGGDLNTVPAN